MLEFLSVFEFWLNLMVFVQQGLLLARQARAWQVFQLDPHRSDMQDVMVLLTQQLCHRGTAQQHKVLLMLSLLPCLEVAVRLSMGSGWTCIWLHLF